MAYDPEVLAALKEQNPNTPDDIILAAMDLDAMTSATPKGLNYSKEAGLRSVIGDTGDGAEDAGGPADELSFARQWAGDKPAQSKGSGRSFANEMEFAQAWGDDGTQSAPAANSDGDASRGFKRAFAQIPELLYGTGALVGMTAENLFGEGGISTATKNYFAQKFQQKQQENQQYAPTVEFDGAWDSIKKGDLQPMVDWIQDSAGYVVGQGIQTIATGGVGAIVGKAALTKMVGGMAVKQAEKLVAQSAAKTGVATLSMEEATKIAATRMAQAIGAGTTLNAQNLGMEAGDIYGGLIEEAKKTGKPITGEDLLRAWGAAAVAAGTETATDMLGLGAAAGRIKIGNKAISETPGMKGRLARGTVAAGVGAPLEGAQEYVQTGLEQYGAGQPLDTDAAAKERLNAAAVGALGGAVMGGGAGMIARPAVGDILDPNKTTDEAIQAANDFATAGNEVQSVATLLSDADANYRSNLAAQNIATQTGMINQARINNNQSDLEFAAGQERLAAENAKDRTIAQTPSNEQAAAAVQGDAQTTNLLTHRVEDPMLAFSDGTIATNAQDAETHRQDVTQQAVGNATQAAQANLSQVQSEEGEARPATVGKRKASLVTNEELAQIIADPAAHISTRRAAIMERNARAAEATPTATGTGGSNEVTSTMGGTTVTVPNAPAAKTNTVAQAYKILQNGEKLPSDKFVLRNVEERIGTEAMEQVRQFATGRALMTKEQAKAAEKLILTDGRVEPQAKVQPTTLSQPVAQQQLADNEAGQFSTNRQEQTSGTTPTQTVPQQAQQSAPATQSSGVAPTVPLAPGSINRSAVSAPVANKDAEAISNAIAKTNGGKTPSITLENVNAEMGKTPLQRGTVSMVKGIGKLFKKKIIFFSSPDVGTEGAVFQEKGDNRIYINVNSNVDALRVVGHELMHKLKQQSPRAYENLRTALSTVVTNKEALREMYRDYNQANKDLTDEQVDAELDKPGARENLIEEMLSDLGGNRFAESEFWSDLFTRIEQREGREKAKGIIARLREAMLMALSQMKRLFTGNAFKADEFAGVADRIDQVRHALVEAYATYLQDVRADGTMDEDATMAGDVRASETPKRPGSDNDHKRTSKGEYVGAPPGMNPSKLGKLRLLLTKLAREGEPGRMWYEESSDAILAAAEGNKALAEKIAGLLAIYSPQMTVSGNTTVGLKAFYQWMNGEQIKAKTGTQDKKAQAWMDGTMGEDDALQIKTGNFFKNLMRKIDEDRYGFEKQGATIDMWMARVFGYGSKSIGSEARYLFAERDVKKLAGDLGWEPQQIQAALWVSIKSRVEEIADDAREYGKAQGWLERKVVKSNGKENISWPPKPEFREKYEMHILKMALSLDDAKAAEGIGKSKYNFGTALKERVGQISWEALPGRTSGALPGIFDAPLEQQLEYLVAMDNALRDENGNDLIAAKLGLPVLRTSLGPSAWQMDVGVGAQTTVAIATDRDQGNKKVTINPSARKLLNAYAAIRGYILKQEAVVWHYPLFDAAKKHANGIQVDIGRDPTVEETRAFYDAIHDVTGREDWAPAYVPGVGWRVLNFDESVDGLEFAKQMRSVIEFAQIPDPRVRTFKSEGDYISNDFSKHPDGAGYKEWINGKDSQLEGSGTGRSDLQGWIESELRPRVERVEKEFAAKYGWDKPAGHASGGIEPERGTDGNVKASERREGAVSGVGVHYSQQQRAVLSSSAFGTGLKGAELQRVQNASDPRLKHRIYFYMNVGRGINPESGVGAHAHTAQLDNLYDASADAMDLWVGRNPTDFESAVLDAGFDGYMSQDSGIAVMLGQRAQKVDYAGAGKPTVDRAGQADPSAYVAAQRAIAARKDLPAGQMAGAEWKARLPEMDLSHLEDGEYYSKSALAKRPAAKFSQMRAVDTSSQEFKKWSHNLPIIGIDDGHIFEDGAGVVVSAIHGTTGDFSAFDVRKANLESDLGGGLYFTNTPDDAGNNYAGEGPDLTSKLEMEVERQRDFLEDDEWSEGKTSQEIDDEAWRRARNSLNVENAGASMPVYVRFDKPIVLGGPHETFLDYEENYNEELDEYEEPTGEVVRFIEALREEGQDPRYDGADIESAISELWESVSDNGGISASDLIAKLSASEGLSYTTDMEHDLNPIASKEIIRKAFAAVGYDGFIDQTVNEKFGSKRRVGKSMDGMSEGTVHFIAFSPTQIKSAISNTGEFSDTNPDIRMSPARDLDFTGNGDTLTPSPFMTEEEIDEAQRLFLSAFPADVRTYRRSSGTAKAARVASERATLALGKSATAPRKVEGVRMGPFSGFETEASIERDFFGNDQLVINLWGKEQLEQDLWDDPALKMTVSQDGDFSIYGPPSRSNTFKEFKKRGWAEFATDPAGEIHTIDGESHWTRLTGSDEKQAINLLGDAHARLRNWTGKSHVGMHWVRTTGATGGEAGKRGAMFFSPPRIDPSDPFWTKIKSDETFTWKEWLDALATGRRGGKRVGSAAVSEPLTKAVAGYRGATSTAEWGADLGGQGPYYSTGRALASQKNLARFLVSFIPKRYWDGHSELSESDRRDLAVTSFGFKQLPDGKWQMDVVDPSEGSTIYEALDKDGRLEHLEQTTDDGSHRYVRAILDDRYTTTRLLMQEAVRRLGMLAQGVPTVFIAGRDTGARAGSKKQRVIESDTIAASFSTPRIIGDSGRQYTPAQRAMFGNVGREIDQLSVAEKLKAWASQKWAQGLVDQFAPVKDLSEKAYTLMRLSKGATGAMEAFMHHGKLSLRDGAYDSDTSGGVMQNVFLPLGKETTDFLYWVAGNRAERLSAEDREHLFRPQDIAAAKSLADGKLDFDYVLANGQTTRDRRAAYADSAKKFSAANKNVMDMAEQSGLIDKDGRQYWEHEFYVPFYRVSEDDAVRGANVKSGVIRQEAFKKLKGGTEGLNDLLSNTLMNWAHLIDASAKNRAAQATLEAAEKLGVARPAVHGEKKTVWFMRDGEKAEYKVDDPYLLTAINGLDYAGLRGPMMDALSRTKHWLTMGVTASPFFKIRNLIRDSVQAIATSDLGYNPVSNVAKGWKLTDRASQEYVSALAGGGLIRFGTMLEGSEAARTRQLIKQGAKDAHILDNESKIRAFYDKYLEPGITAYNELGNRGEEINRMSLYDQLIKQGKDHATASLMARDLMDFSMQGSFTSIRFLTQVVPFMNARLQGLYKLGRAGKEDPAKMAVVTGMVALASLALLAAYHDDDDWKRREDWDRNNYWWFKFGGTSFRIPKPFEIGAIATLAERSAEFIFDKEMTGKRFRQVTQQVLSDQLSMNPIPQLVKPIIDVYSNKDAFTGRPIETMSMEKLDPQQRYNARTWMPARYASQAVGGAMSPVQIEHLVRGYFSWLGAFVVGGADMAVRAASSEPTRPTLDYWKFASGGMVSELDGASSRYVSQMYDQAKELEQAYGTWRQLIKEGKISDAKEYRADHLEELKKYPQVENIKRAEAKLNERIRMIERSNKSPDEKKAMIEAIKKQQDKLARRIA